MRYQLGIGIFCVLLVFTGTAAAESYTFTDSYDGTYVTGEITYDESGIINGGVIAGVTHGEMDVQQGSSQDGGNVVLGQSGEIQGDGGFAGTLVDDGNGNQGGNFASFTGGGMIVGQVSAGGEISDSGVESAGEFNALTDTQASSYLEGLTLGGVVNGQFVSIEGASGYAASGSRNGNGAYALSTASVSQGGMGAIQVSGSGDASLGFSYLDSDFSSSLGRVSPFSQIELSGDGVFAGQGVDMEGDSGSASTSVSNRYGASGQSSASFSNGRMGVIQAGLAGDASLSLPDYITGTGDQLTREMQQGSATVDGVIVGQGVDMGGDSGSASTSVSNRYGASGQSSASFSNGGMGVIQAGLAGDASLSLPDYITGTGSQLTGEVQESATVDGVIVGQGVDMGGDSGSASTMVTDGNGASGQSSASFTHGGMYGIQAGAGYDVSLSYPYYTSPEPADLSIGGVISGQGMEIGGGSGSASTSVTNGNGASGQSSASFTRGGMDVLQVGAAGDASLDASNLILEPYIPEPGIDLSVGAGGAIVGQDVGMRARDGGSASTTVTNGDGASAQASSSFTRGRMDVLQVAGTADASLGLGYPSTTSSILTTTPLAGGSTQEVLSLDVIFAGQDGYISGRNGEASSSVTGVNGNSAGTSASFTRRGNMDFTQASAGITADLNPVSPSTGDLSGVLSYQDVESDSFRRISTSTYSQTAGNSNAEVNAAARGSGLFDTTQFAGGITAGNLDVALAGQDVFMKDVTHGSASGSSSDSNGNTASVSTYVNRGAGKLILEGDYPIPSGIITGAGDIGGISGALAVHDEVLIRGRSGGLRTEAGNSTGGSAYVDATFSDGGRLESGGSSFLGMTGGALSGQYAGTNAIGALEMDLDSSGSTTSFLETGITGVSPATRTAPGSYEAYSYSWPGFPLGPSGPLSEIIP